MAEKESWEHIAPELPPGWEWQGDIPINDSRGLCITRGGTLGENQRICWGTWERRSGITRKAYAELIAPGLVRVAAIEKHGRRDLAVQHTHGDGIQAFEVLRWGKVLARGIGYDLCDAAWACIQALGGGE